MGIAINSGEKQTKQNIKKNNLEITFGVFFDGTLNNIKNVDARRVYEEYNKKYEIYVKENGKDETKILENVFSNELEKKTAYEAYDNNRTEGPVDDDRCHDGYDYYTKPDDVSYENDYTNPARLFQCKKNENYGIYIEGSGSLSYKEDNRDGSGYGYKETGIRAKVRKGCEKLADKIAKSFKKQDNIGSIHLIVDTYGFSRGAAAARNFIFEITRTDGIKEIEGDEDLLEIDGEIEKLHKAIDHQKYLSNEEVRPHGFLGYYLKEKGVDIKEIKFKITIRFAGLYDTVSSYGVKTFFYKELKRDLSSAHPDTPISAIELFNMINEEEPLIPNFANDVKELELQKISENAKYILHLTAHDEHRKNFALTKIKSKNKNHIELSLPGAHADVGGSYIDNTDERKYVYETNSQRGLKYMLNNYEEWGWFKKKEQLKGTIKVIHGKYYTLYNYEHFRNKLFYKRLGLSNKYSYIPLHLMVMYMDKFEVKYENTSAISKDLLEKDYSLVTGSDRTFTRKELCKMIGYNLDSIFEKVKKHFEDQQASSYVISTGKAWKKYIEEDIKEILRGDFLTHYYITAQDPLIYIKERLIDENFDEQKNDLYVFHTAEQLLLPYINFQHLKDNKNKFASILCHQLYIRWLRNRFLHHSADEHSFVDWTDNKILRVHRGRWKSKLPNRKIYE